MLILAYLAGAVITAIVMAASNLRFARRLRRRREALETAVPFGDLPVYQVRGWHPPACADWCFRQFM